MPTPAAASERLRLAVKAEKENCMRCEALFLELTVKFDAYKAGTGARPSVEEFEQWCDCVELQRSMHEAKRDPCP